MWVYNGSGRSVLIVALFHSAFNSAGTGSDYATRYIEEIIPGPAVLLIPMAVVVVAGALAAGGVAAAATGHLPGPVREAARSILATGGGEPPASTGTGPRPAPVTGTGSAGGAGGEGSRPGGATGAGLGPVGAGPAASPDLEGLCQAFRSGNGAEQGARLDAASFRALARAAGGEEEVAAFCEAVPPADDKAKEPSASEGPGRPDPPGGGGNQGQGGPGTSSPAPGR